MNALIIILYSVLELLLIMKLIDIIRAPTKYNVIEGYENYKKSSWYWNPNKPYGKLDPPENARYLLGMPAVVISAHCFVIKDPLQRLLFHSTEAEYVVYEYMLNGSRIVQVLWFFIALLAFCYIQMRLRFPASICFNCFTVFPKEKRSVALKKIIIILSVCIAIYVPLRVLQLNNYAAVYEDRIEYSSFFSCEENIIKYDTIRTKAIYNDKGERIVHYYIIGENEEVFDLYRILPRYRDEVLTVIQAYLPAALYPSPITELPTTM